MILRSGALPASIKYLEERTVGPSLGADSIRSGVRAAIIGMVAVLVFMLIYYRKRGHQRRHGADPEPGDSAGVSGIQRGDADAAWNRRT